MPIGLSQGDRLPVPRKGVHAFMVRLLSPPGGFTVGWSSGRAGRGDPTWMWMADSEHVCAGPTRAFFCRCRSPFSSNSPLEATRDEYRSASRVML